MKKLSLFACLCLLLFASAASAEPVTLTFDELPVQSVSTPTADLSFMGVTFRFRVGGLPSPDARYGAEGPGDFTFIEGRVLEGDVSGTLTLDFSAPTVRLAFGAALSSFENLSPGLTVELFNPSLASLGVTPLNTTNLLGISEGQFNYVGAPISRAVINFNQGFTPIVPGVERFAIDNLTIEPVPEPTTMLLLGTGLAGIAAAVRKHRKDKAE